MVVWESEAAATWEELSVNEPSKGQLILALEAKHFST